MSEPKKTFSMYDPANTSATAEVDFKALELKKQQESLKAAERLKESLVKKQEIKPCNMQPLEDRLIIKTDVNTELTTAAGIYIANAENSQPARGTIVACGPGTLTKPMPLKVGDRVMYGHYAGTNVEDPETKEVYLVMRLADVFIKL